VRENRWFKSTQSSESAGCVEVNVGPTVRVRDSKNPDGPRLAFSRQAWQEFVQGVRDGAFDLDDE
jgi:hypothetical protein